jgi:hypothetical protein
MDCIVTLHQPSPLAARFALMIAGPVCVSEEFATGSTLPPLSPGCYAYRARFVGIENGGRVFKLLELLERPKQ